MANFKAFAQWTIQHYSMRLFFSFPLKNLFWHNTLHKWVYACINFPLFKIMNKIECLALRNFAFNSICWISPSIFFLSCAHTRTQISSAIRNEKTLHRLLFSLFNLFYYCIVYISECCFMKMSPLFEKYLWHSLYVAILPAASHCMQGDNFFKCAI